MNWIKPRRTVESVARELYKGLSNGSIQLPTQQEQIRPPFGASSYEVIDVMHHFPLSIFKKFLVRQLLVVFGLAAGMGLGLLYKGESVLVAFVYGMAYFFLLSTAIFAGITHARNRGLRRRLIAYLKVLDWHTVDENFIIKAFEWHKRGIIDEDEYKKLIILFFKKSQYSNSNDWLQ